MKTLLELKIEALANFLEIEAEEIEQSSYDVDGFKAEGCEYLVYTDAEADEATKNYIEDSLWAFNADFILSHSKITCSDRVVKAFREMQQSLCEDANELVKGILVDFDDFVEDAISCDGRGHFLSHYDGEENESDIDDSFETYYIYRTN